MVLSDDRNAVALTPDLQLLDGGGTEGVAGRQQYRMPVVLQLFGELADAGGAGIDRAVAYRRDPEVLTLEVPSDFEQLEAEKRNLEYVIDCIESFGGVIIYYPLSISFGDGI